MEFNAESIAEEVNKQYAGITITDGADGPFLIKHALRLSSERRKMIEAVGNQMDRLLKAPKVEIGGEEVDDPDFEIDYDAVRELQVDALALRCDEPQQLRDWLVGKDPAVVTVLQKQLNKESEQEKAEAQ